MRYIYMDIFYNVCTRLLIIYLEFIHIQTENLLKFLAVEVNVDICLL